MDRINRNPTSLSSSIQSKHLKMLAVGLGALVSICALAALAIGLYFLISKNNNTASTTSTTPGKHYCDLQSRAMGLKEFVK